MAYLQPGMRGGIVLIHDGYRYQKNRARGNKIHWRCWRPTCRVALQTVMFDVRDPAPEIQVLQAPEHLIHAPEDELIRSREFVLGMLRAVEADPSRPTRRVYDEAIRQHPALEETPSYESVRSQLERRRAELMPPVPH